MRYTLILLILLNFQVSAQKKKETMNDSRFLESLLLKKPKLFKSLISEKDSLRIQIIYTRIDRDKANQPSFAQYAFNVDDQQYFYPASTVKLPIALLALEKLNELNIAGLDKNTTMITEAATEEQTAVYNHPMAKDGRPTIANYIKQIFLVSDNDAYNRLYEFLGQEYIQRKLAEKGIDAAIRHRLQLSLTPEQNKNTNPIVFYDSTGKVIYKQAAASSRAVYPTIPTFLGSGYYQNNQLINASFNFTEKNRISLSQLHSILQRVLFPASFNPKQRFNLTKDDYNFLYQWMGAYTNESNNPTYDTASYWPAYTKLLLLGAQKGAAPANIRIYNKEGDAYGFLTDVAYITDTKNNIEFMLSATIYCNSDGIFNDDKYDYDAIGYPFMKNLGQIIYEYELKRDREFIPVLPLNTINSKKE